MLRIGYLNPYLGLAEDQAFHSLQAAGIELGVELIGLLPSELREEHTFDFIISTTSAVRKTTSHPTFLSTHAPSPTYLESNAAFQSTLSYDGYLAISASLRKFFAHLAAGIDRPVIEPGFYYNSPQKLALAADLPRAAAEGHLALCYFGTNWDRRAQRLFRRLADQSSMHFYGPADAWEGLVGRAYKGSVPFDGVSVQRTYAEHGVGLVCLSQEHLVEDIVSNRIFEISSVGAVAICPDTAWFRRNFNDAVFYYDPFVTSEETAAQINAAMQTIRRDPIAAAEMGAAARSVFEGRFDAGSLIQNAIRFHQSWADESSRRHAGFVDAEVDVIIRTGGRPLRFLERAIASLEKQTCGRFRLILVAYTDIDLSPVLERDYIRIASIEVLNVPKGNRSQTLCAGLGGVKSQYFCVLDDDDYFLSSHIQNLVAAISSIGGEDKFAYSDILRLDDSGDTSPPWNNGLSVLREGPAFGDINQLFGRFTSHCFLATSSTLSKVPFQHWQLHTAEDVLLICSLLRYAVAAHAPGATCVYSQGRDDSSAYLEDSGRREDEAALVAEISGFYEQVEARFSNSATSPRALIYQKVRQLLEGRRTEIHRQAKGTAVLGQWLELSGAPSKDSELLPALFDDPDLVFLEAPLTEDRLSGNALEPGGVGPDGVRLNPLQPWELSLVVDIADYLVPNCAIAAVLDFEGADEPVTVGLVSFDGQTTSQVNVPASTRPLRAGARSADGVRIHAVALQAGGKPSSRPVTVRRLSLGYAKKELAAALSIDGRSVEPEAALNVVREQVLKETVNAPLMVGAGEPRSVAFRSDQSVFRSSVADGYFSLGAVRTISSGLIPWDYFGQIYLTEEAVAGAHWLRVRLGRTEEAIFAMIVKSDFTPLPETRIRIRGNKVEVEAWLDLSNLPADGYLIFQAGERPRDRPMDLLAIDSF